MPLQTARIRKTQERAPRPPLRAAAIVSLCERRAQTQATQNPRSEEHRTRTQSSAATLRSIGAVAGNAAATTLSVGVLLMLWPVAKLAGVFGWSDCDERS